MRRMMFGRGGCFACIAFLMLGLAAPSADAIILDFVSDPGANVTFVSTASGADFTFEDEVAGNDLPAEQRTLININRRRIRRRYYDLQ